MQTCVTTVAIGEKTQRLLRISGPTFARYAERMGAAYEPITEASGSISGQIDRLLERYHRVVYVDVGSMIHPQAPNIFERVPETHCGVGNEEPLRDCTEKINAIQQKLGAIRGWQRGYFSSRVLVISSGHRALFQEAPGDDKVEARCFWNDPDHLNWKARSLGIPLHDLDHRFNRTSSHGKLNPHAWMIHFTDEGFSDASIDAAFAQMEILQARWENPRIQNISLDRLYLKEGHRDPTFPFRMTITAPEQELGSYGPYLPLAEGRYQFCFQYEWTTDGEIPENGFEFYLGCQLGERILYRNRVEATSQEHVFEFDFPEVEDLEICFLGGKKPYHLHRLQLEYLGPLQSIQLQLCPETAPSLVSVVIATYNRADTLRLAIESVLQQTWQELEILVIGDACTDRTAEVVSSFHDPRIRWENLSVNSGSQSIPNNRGIELARGAYIAYLGHDDLWHPEHLKSLLDVFQDDPTVDFAFSLCLMLGDPFCGGRAVAGYCEHGFFCPEDFVPPSSLMHRKSVIDKTGGWRDFRQFRQPPDAEFERRLVTLGLHGRGTEKPTTFKFNSAWRPKSYSHSTCAEQEDFLRRMRWEPNFLQHELLKTLEAFYFLKPVSRVSLKQPVGAPPPPGWYVRANRIIRGLDTADQPEQWISSEPFYVLTHPLRRFLERQTKPLHEALDFTEKNRDHLAHLLAAATAEIKELREQIDRGKT